MIFGAPVSLLFSLRPPTRNALSQKVYPFPRDIQTLESKVVAVEKLIDLPPPELLHELHSSTNPNSFHTHVAIGLPENSVFPTLSYHDFYSLSTHNNLRWSSILKTMKDKYLPLKGTDKPGNGFYDCLDKAGDDGDGTMSILLYPGRWNGFGVREAQILSQTLLVETGFGVFICARAHSLSTVENAQELNPLLTGEGTKR